MANIRDNLDEVILHVRSIRKTFDEDLAGKKAQSIKYSKREIRPDNAPHIMQAMIGALKQDSLRYQSYVDTVALMSPYTSARIQKLLDLYEKERIRVTEMFDENYMKGFKEPSIEWLHEIQRIEKETKLMGSLSDHMDKVLTIAYSCFLDMIKFLEK